MTTPASSANTASLQCLSTGLSLLVARVLGVGSVFTQAELDSSAVQYKHGGGEQLDDKFEIRGQRWRLLEAQPNRLRGPGRRYRAVRIPHHAGALQRQAHHHYSHTGLLVLDSSITGKPLPSISLGDIDPGRWYLKQVSWTSFRSRWSFWTLEVAHMPTVN